MDQQDNDISNLRTYKSLPAWQRAMALAIRVLHLTQKWPEEDRDVITPDALRSAVLVACNIELGHESGSMSELFEHLDVARGKLARLRSLLIIAQQVGYYSLEEYEEVSGEIDTIRMLIDSMPGSPGSF